MTRANTDMKVERNSTPMWLDRGMTADVELDPSCCSSVSRLRSALPGCWFGGTVTAGGFHIDEE